MGHVQQFEHWRSVSGVLAIATAVAIAVAFIVLPAKAPEGAANLNFTVEDMNGKTVRLADYRGRPVILNFWATWCGPCRIEIPELNALADEYKAEGLAVLGVSVDDEPETLRKFTERVPMNYPVLVGRGHTDLQQTYDAVVAVPVTWFIRADGTVQAVQKGGAERGWFAAQAKLLVKSASGEHQ